jgi:hypothetical protein
MANDMANIALVVTALITREVIAGLDPAIHHFKSAFDEEAVIPGRAKREPGISRFPDVQLHI